MEEGVDRGGRMGTKRGAGMSGSKHFHRPPVTDEETRAEAALARDSATRDWGSGTIVGDLVYIAKLPWRGLPWLWRLPGRLSNSD